MANSVFTSGTQNHSTFNILDHTLSDEKYIPNRVYNLVSKKYVLNKKKHFKYGWSHNPEDILNYFDEQKSLSPSERYVKNGDYVVLFYDRDSREFGYASLGNDPSYRQRTFRMK